MNKAEIEQAAIKYSDKVNMEGETSFSIAEAFEAGANYMSKPLIDEITQLKKDLHIISFGAIENIKEIEQLKLQLNATDSDYHKRIEKLQKANEWISVESEEKPIDKEYVIVTNGKQVTEAQYYNYSKKFIKEDKELFVTKWMSYPKP